MELVECIAQRRSIREYTAEPVSNETIEGLIAVASYAPSWKNSQTVRYVLVRNPELKENIADDCVLGFASNAKIIRNAPALILVTTLAKRAGYERDGSFTTSKGTHWESFDAGIATQTLCLAAHNEGLGTVIMGIYDERKVIDVVGIPEGQTVAAMVAIGYPAQQPAMPPRKDVPTLLSVRE